MMRGQVDGQSDRHFTTIIINNDQQQDLIVIYRAANK